MSDEGTRGSGAWLGLTCAGCFAALAPFLLAGLATVALLSFLLGRLVGPLAQLAVAGESAGTAGATQGRSLPPNNGGAPDVLPTLWLPGAAPHLNQGYGRTAFADANPEIYAYAAAYGGVGHPGLDLGFADGTQLYTPVAGRIVIAGGSGYYRDETGRHPDATSGEIRLERPNGDLIIFGHTSRVQVAVGQALATGAPLGLTGTANGPHLHLEVRIADGTMPSGYRLVDPRDYFKYWDFVDRSGD